ncbi:MAG: imidazole glycerol phosphate synthase subunit HisH [Thermoplasmatales archaeon Gpl]|nr:MAG: imidazole glycerol phosphate synthase subunit HisH [Thermoplasmatales archaeon Gpl]
MIAIVDLGIGNFSNVAKAVGGKVTADQYEIEKAEKIVLPGVGSFHTVASELERLRGVLLDRIREGIPVLGICLGMQVLTEESEEGLGRSRCDSRQDRPAHWKDYPTSVGTVSDSRNPTVSSKTLMIILISTSCTHTGLMSRKNLSRPTLNMTPRSSPLQ